MTQRYLKKNKRQKYESKGRFAEFWASFLLLLKGYRILERRYKNPMGEIDLILQKGKTIVFCEVKARSSLNKGLEALAPYQQKRIVNGARYFQAKHSWLASHDFRFDYIIVCRWHCYHMKNAWQAQK